MADEVGQQRAGQCRGVRLRHCDVGHLWAFGVVFMFIGEEVGCRCTRWRACAPSFYE